MKEINAVKSPVAREIHREELEKATRRYILCLDPKSRDERLEHLEEIREKTERELRDLKDRFERSQERRRKRKRGKPLTKEGAIKRAQKILNKNERLFTVTADETFDRKLDEDKWE